MYVGHKSHVSKTCCSAFVSSLLFTSTAYAAVTLHMFCTRTVRGTTKQAHYAPTPTLNPHTPHGTARPKGPHTNSRPPCTHVRRNTATHSRDRQDASTTTAAAATGYKQPIVQTRMKTTHVPRETPCAHARVHTLYCCCPDAPDAGNTSTGPPCLLYGPETPALQLPACVP